MQTFQFLQILKDNHEETNEKLKAFFDLYNHQIFLWSLLTGILTISCLSIGTASLILSRKYFLNTISNNFVHFMTESILKSIQEQITFEPKTNIEQKLNAYFIQISTKLHKFGLSLNIFGIIIFFVIQSYASSHENVLKVNIINLLETHGNICKIICDSFFIHTDNTIFENFNSYTNSLSNANNITSLLFESIDLLTSFRANITQTYT